MLTSKNIGDTAACQEKFTAKNQRKISEIQKTLTFFFTHCATPDKPPRQPYSTGRH
jgi:hypothetical protein